MTLVTISARSSAGFTMTVGQRLRIVDVNGGQVCDLLAYRRGEPSEHLSNGRTFDYGGKIALSVSDVLWSSLSNPMLTIVGDDVGRHDFLYAACSVEMYRLQYGVTANHPNCTENLTGEFRKLGFEPGPLPTPFNVFQNAVVAADGKLVLSAPLSKAGDAIVLRAEMDLAIALSACPAGVCNGGTPKPIAYELLDG